MLDFRYQPIQKHKAGCVKEVLVNGKWIPDEEYREIIRNGEVE